MSGEGTFAGTDLDYRARILGTRNGSDTLQNGWSNEKVLA
jgi:hypothetical protein